MKNTKPIGNIERHILFHKKTEDIYCIGSRESDKYLYAPAEESEIIFFVLEQLAENREESEIQEAVNKKYSNYKEINVESIIERCKTAGLVSVAKGEKIKKNIDEFELMLVELKELKLERMYGLFEFLAKYFTILITGMLSIVILALLSFIIHNRAIVFPWTAVFSDGKALLYMWVIQFLSLVLHEFSHAIIGYKYGIKPKSLTIAVFYYCSLMFFIRLPGIYFQEPEKRVKIWSSGIFTHLVLASASFLIYLCADVRFQLFFAVGVISNLLQIVSNIMPFFYSDGYYILATLLKTPNLRKKSLFQIKKLWNGGFDRDAAIYWGYLIITAVVTIFLVGGQLVAIFTSIISELEQGNGLSNVISNYSNLFIILGLGIVGKMIAQIKKKKQKQTAK